MGCRVAGWGEKLSSEMDCSETWAAEELSSEMEGRQVSRNMDSREFS